MELTIEEVALQEFEKVGDEQLFPNHSDKDIWISGFKAGYLLAYNHENCKCIKFTGGSRWYTNGCKIHSDDNN